MRNKITAFNKWRRASQASDRISNHDAYDIWSAAWNARGKRDDEYVWRRKFAGQALPEWVRAHIEHAADDLSKEDIARECVSYADALIAELGREDKPCSETSGP